MIVPEVLCESFFHNTCNTMHSKQGMMHTLADIDLEVHVFATLFKVRCPCICAIVRALLFEISVYASCFCFSTSPRALPFSK